MVRVNGNFVVLTLSALDFPFQTRLTIIARRHGFDNIVMAYDCRKDRENHFLGLAVMLPSPISERLETKKFGPRPLDKFNNC